MKRACFSPLVLLGLLLSYSTVLNAQQEHPGIILERLLKARGGHIPDPPQLRIIARRGRVASYSPRLNQILLEEEAVGICRTLGEQRDDALAFLIAHELTHFYQHQVWKRKEADRVHFFAKNKRFSANIELESEADTYGAFVAYLAGYDYYTVAPLLIDRLYDAYDIDSSGTRGYPSLKIRKDLTRTVCKQVREYCRLFEAANALHLLGKYERSQIIYEHLLNYLDLSEIYYNAGLNQMKAAIASRPPAQFPIALVQKLTLRSEFPTDSYTLLERSLKNLIQAAKDNAEDHSIFIAILVNSLCQWDIATYDEVKSDVLSVNPSTQIKEQIQLLEALKWKLDPNAPDLEKCKMALSDLHSETVDTTIKTLCLANLTYLEEDARPVTFKSHRPLIRHRRIDDAAQTLGGDGQFSIRCAIEFSEGLDRVTIKDDKSTNSLVFVDDFKNSFWKNEIDSRALQDFVTSSASSMVFTDPAIILIKQPQGIVNAVLYR